jgi:hypothetical protein
MTDYRPSRAVHNTAATPPTRPAAGFVQPRGPGDRIAGPEYTTSQAPRPHRTHPPRPRLSRGSRDTAA